MVLILYMFEHQMINFLSLKWINWYINEIWNMREKIDVCVCIDKMITIKDKKITI